MADKIIRPRRCLKCPDRFTPRHPEQVTCSRACGYALQADRKHGHAPEPAIEKLREMHRAAIRLYCFEAWGELSVREVEIFKFATRMGYRRGYMAMYRGRKSKAA